MQVAFIERTKNAPPPYQYYMGKPFWFSQRNGNCLSIGPGAGRAEVNLIKYGWRVTAVDSCKYSHKIMNEQLDVKDQRKLNFIHGDFAQFTDTKKYNMILAINSLPFIKVHLSKILPLLKKNGIIIITLFAPDHGFVKQKKASGITKKEIKNIMKKYQILFLEHVKYKRKDDMLWSSFDIIAKSK